MNHQVSNMVDHHPQPGWRVPPVWKEWLLENQQQFQQRDTFPGNEQKHVAVARATQLQLSSFDGFKNVKKVFNGFALALKLMRPSGPRAEQSTPSKSEADSSSIKSPKSSIKSPKWPRVRPGAQATAVWSRRILWSRKERAAPPPAADPRPTHPDPGG